MKKNYLRRSGFLALSLLLSYSVQSFCNPAQQVVAVVNVVKATEIIKNSFDLQDRRIKVITFTQFIEALKVFNAEFGAFSHASNIQDIYNCVQKNKTSLPPALRDYFNISAAEFKIIVNERKAFEYFGKNFFGPLNKVAKWEEFANTMITLLEGNSLLYPLQKVLKETQNLTGFIAKITITSALTQDDVVRCIPTTLVEKIKQIPVMELKERIKTY